MTWSLVLAAGAVAATHTLLGPDHYLPFVMLARARGWSLLRTLLVTAVCGLGHVASSVLLGGIGLALGFAVFRIEGLESARGSVAAWALVAFGSAYAFWGIRKAIRASRGIEPHSHHGHVHLHTHGKQEHEHQHEVGKKTTFWALFIIFVLGPCEPLIPLFVLPAAHGSWGLAAITAAVFALVTIGTMLGVTAALLSGARLLPLGRLERWSHAMAGGVIAASGLAIIFLGL
ncbi:MAG: hypothetical protein GY906_21500 [bacterium]|nr:hypothetical protein [bacterium]